MKRLYLISFILSFLITLFGALLKIMHWPGAALTLSSGMLLSLVYIFIALEDIYKRKNKTLFEKLIWLPAFICFSWITGLVYYIKELDK